MHFIEPLANLMLSCVDSVHISNSGIQRKLKAAKEETAYNNKRRKKLTKYEMLKIVV
jgi:hypothetical protein